MNGEYLSSFLHTVWHRITGFFSLCLCVGAIDGNATMNAGIVEIQCSLLDGGEWSGLAPWLLYTWGERTPGTHWMGSWVGPGASLDVWRREQFFVCGGKQLWDVCQNFLDSLHDMLPNAIHPCVMLGTAALIYCVKPLEFPFMHQIYCVTNMLNNLFYFP
jgi:hypothetical protein